MPRKKISNRLLIILAVTATSLALLLGAMAANPPNPTGSIYSNMYIHNIPVGGLTTEEAEAALMQHFQTNLDEVTITFTHGSQEVYQLNYRNMGIMLDFTSAVQAAREYSTRRNLPSRVARLLGRPHNVTLSPTLRYDEGRIASRLHDIANKLQTPPKNASFVYENGQLTTLPAHDGITVDIESATTQLSEMIASMEGGNIELITSATPPRYTEADLQFNMSSLGAYSTEITAGIQDPRVRNVSRASQRIHNQMLYPGDVFSASALMGTHLPGSGYEAAIVLVRGEPVEDIGGGICQVVTTLYNAVLLAELTVIQRHNHSARVSYAEFGFDATIAGDYYDLKFKNTTSHPILITSRLAANALYVSIHGYEHRPPNRSVQFSSRRVDVIHPEPYKEVVDASLAPGERVVTLEAQMGYKYEVFKHVYVDGREVEEVKVSTSSYRPLQGIVSIGQDG
ncbi:MAG: VanW family protein [Defluviitaleaceae bacterium]|nr:VanW family protein [Defluviitaleaceae bacterium]